MSATARWVRVPPRKARLVSAVVVGMPVEQALTVLSFMPQAAAADIAKVVRSAAANAQNNFNLEGDRLRVQRLEVEGGPTVKRFRPRARGSYFSIFKRTCHLRAVVDDTLEPTPRGGRARGGPRRPRAAAPATPVSTPSAPPTSDDEE